MYSFKRRNPQVMCCPRSPCRCGDTQVLPGRWEALLFLKSSFRNDTTPHWRTFMVRKCFLIVTLNSHSHTPALSPFSQSPRGTWKTFVLLKLLIKLFPMIIPLIAYFQCAMYFTHILSSVCQNPEVYTVFLLYRGGQNTEMRFKERLGNNWWRQDLNLRSCLLSVHQL